MKKIKEQTDEQLVSSYIAGNNAAFDALLHRWRFQSWFGFDDDNL